MIEVSSSVSPQCQMMFKHLKKERKTRYRKYTEPICGRGTKTPTFVKRIRHMKKSNICTKMWFLTVPHQDDRSLINLHLMHTSYFLFVMVITMFCYAVIKGRPGKVRQTNPDFCPEKVRAARYEVNGTLNRTKTLCFSSVAGGAVRRLKKESQRETSESFVRTGLELGRTQDMKINQLPGEHWTYNKGHTSSVNASTPAMLGFSNQRYTSACILLCKYLFIILLESPLCHVRTCSV